MNETIQIIKARRSVRKFKQQTIPEDIIKDVLDCARYAPSARNIQPWIFGVITDPQLKAKVAALTTYGKFIKDAPVCFAVFTDQTQKYFLEDGSAATENIILACQAYGIGTCWVAGHKNDYAAEIEKLLNVPDNYTLISLIPAGYPDQDPAPRNKKSLEEVIFFNRFGG